MEDLKEYRKHELKTYVIANIFLIVLILKPSFWSSSIEDKTNFLILFEQIISISFISSTTYLYIFFIDSLIPVSIKNILVFLFWKRPGETIFSRMKIKNIDNRFSSKQALMKYKEIYSQLETKGKKEKPLFENSEWYKIYKKYDTKPSVRETNKEYLMFRDLCSLTVSFFLIYVMFICFNIIQFNYKIFILLFLEYIIVNISCHNRAHRFVNNVIAEDITEKNS